MHVTKLAPQAALLSLLAACASSGASEPEGPQWTELFNGQDLTGWQVKIRGYELGDNHGDTFRVEDGLLKVSYDQYESFDGKFGHIFYEEPFSSYDLRVTYRFVGEQCPGGPGWAFRNSGVMLHGQSAESMPKDQEFPVSIEGQFLGQVTGGGDRPTANLCTPATHVVMDGELHKQHCTNSTSATYMDDGWVTVEFQVRGNESITHLIDGQPVLAYQQPQLDTNDAKARRLMDLGQPTMLSRGTISLQAESHPIEFKSVAVKVYQ